MCDANLGFVRVLKFKRHNYNHSEISKNELFEFLFDMDEKEIPCCIEKASKQGSPRFLYFNCPAGRRGSALGRGGLTDAL